jgi:class 3 adenylate cyclase/tetratricopeptide (TPR) repeat protein
VEERKVVTVLFADLVGFTARAERLDPEDVRALLRPYHERARHELERFGGTVEKFIGDAVMAVFGAPVAHEDDPERAVRAALVLRDAIAELNEAEPSPELEVRIAVHTGEALVTVDADLSRGEGIVAGDVVNTASRLQGFAPVNGVLVGESTYEATRHAIDYEAADPVEARGKSEPLSVWRAGNPIARIGADPRRASTTPLVGREHEVDQLRDALVRVREHESVQLVTLVGVPGIGKSRLVRELFDVVEDETELIRWRLGRSLPYGDGVSFWALGEIVKAEAGIFETDSQDIAEAKLAATVGQRAADAAEAAWIARQLRPLVGLATAEARDETRIEAFAAWRRFIEALADDAPTVLVFEDLHWADDSLLDFVDELVDEALDVPLLVLATARPELLERRATWGGGKRNATTISLAPLSQDETARLLASLLETPVIEADVHSRLLARTEGNPLFAEEYARLLEQRGAIDDLPSTLHGLIAARLDSLGGEEKVAVQAAAVVGETFWVGAVAAVAGGPAPDKALRALERKEFVRRRRRSSFEAETEYTFQHALVRDVAYAQIPRAERGRRHERAAAWIESLGRPDDHAELVAHHYLEALELARAAGRDVAELEPRARAALIEAAGLASAASSVSAARRFYEAALALTPEDDEQRPSLLLRYARTRTDDIEMGVEILSAAYEGLLRQGAVGDAAEAQTLLTSLWWMRGDREQAFTHLERANELVANEPESASKASVLSQVARYEMLAGEFEPAKAVAQRAAAMAERLGLGALLARNLNTAGVSRVESGDPGGLDDLARAAEIARAANSLEEETQASTNRTWMVVMLGDVRRAWDLHLQDCELVERFGSPSMLLWERGERLFYLYWRGEWSEAARRAETFLQEVAATGHYLEGAVLAIEARIARARGDIAGALLLAGKALDRTRSAADPQVVQPCLALLAGLHADAGDAQAAMPFLDELLLASQRAELVKVNVPIDAAWVAVRLRRTEDLLGIYRPAAESSRWIAAAVAIASGAYAEAADLLEEIGSVPDEAFARLRAAEQLAQVGRRPEADAQLARALAFWRSVGAFRYVGEGEALLARAG